MNLRVLVHLWAGIISVAVLVGIVTHSPLAPYNVRDLVDPNHPILSVVLFSLLVYWIGSFPVFTVSLVRGPGTRLAWLLPLLILLHGAVAWLLLRNAVPVESIYDIVGDPVLDWPWGWELLGRFLALFGAVSLQLFGAVMMAGALASKTLRLGAGIVSWLFTSAVLLPLIYWVVVVQAATDNLTELMAGGGGWQSSLWLAAALLIVTSAAALLSALIALRGGRLRWFAPLFIALSFPLAYQALSAGTEHLIIKYNQVFSALQFLLSRDRAHLVTGVELQLRYFILHGAAVGVMALIQYPFWLGLLKGTSKNASFVFVRR